MSRPDKRCLFSWWW